MEIVKWQLHLGGYLAEFLLQLRPERSLYFSKKLSLAGEKLEGLIFPVD